MTLRETGSAELDRILTERERIRAEWRKPRPRLVPPSQPPHQPSIPSFPPLPVYNVKPVEERIAEADKFFGELPDVVVKEIKDCILKSAHEFGEVSSLDEPRTCEYPEIVCTNYVTVTNIQRVVVAHFGITLDQFMSKRRAVTITRARQVAMYLSRTLTRRSMPDIGRRFGGKDHTTVLHAIRKIERLIADSWWVAQEIAMLRRLLEK